MEEVECGLCGREGGSFPGCDLCHGRGENVPLAYTLSDHRARRAPEEDRYSNVGPRIANVPGGAINHPGGGRQ